MKRFVAILFLSGLFVGALFAKEVPSTKVYVNGTFSDGLSNQSGYWKNGVFIPMSYNSMIIVENGDVYHCGIQKGDYNDRRQEYDYYLKVYKNGESLWTYYDDNREIAGMSVSSMVVLNGDVCVGLEISNHSSWHRYYRIIRNGQCVARDAGRCMVVNNGFLYYTSDPSSDITVGYYAGGNVYRFPDYLLERRFQASQIKMEIGLIVLVGKDNYGPCTRINNQEWWSGNKYKGHGSTILNSANLAFYLMDNGEIVTEEGDNVTNILPSYYSAIALDYDNSYLYILALTKQGGMKVYCVITYDRWDRKIISTQTLPGCSNAWQLIIDK